MNDCEVVRFDGSRFEEEREGVQRSEGGRDAGREFRAERGGGKHPAHLVTGKRIDVEEKCQQGRCIGNSGPHLPDCGDSRVSVG